MALRIKFPRRLWPSLAVLGLVMLSAVGLLMIRQHPLNMFRETVLDPVPASVRQIRGDLNRSAGEYTCVLRFKVSPDDLALLVHSGPFDEIAFVEYDRGSLTYGNMEFATTSVQLYRVYEGQSEPGWFDLRRWTRFRAYIVEEEQSDLYNVRLLLYHEGRGEAYFVEHEVRGTWGVNPLGIGRQYRKAREEQEKANKEQRQKQ